MTNPSPIPPDDGPPDEVYDAQAQASAQMVVLPDQPRPSYYPKKPRPDPEIKSAPHNIDAEQGLLACFLLDDMGQGRALVDTFRRDGLSPQHFYRPAHQIIAQAIFAQTDANLPLEEISLANRLNQSGQIDAIGGHAYLYELSARIQTTVHAQHWFTIVRDCFTRRNLIRTAQWAIEQAHKAESGNDPTVMPDLLTEVQSAFSLVAKGTAAKPFDKGRPLTSFVFTKDNPNCLLGLDWIERGGGALCISNAGQGKSTIALQMAAAWGLNRPFFGINPARALKSLVIQAEDSDRYIARCNVGIKAGMNLSDDEIAALSEKLWIRSMRGAIGPAFIAELKLLIAEHKPDLVWINPVYLYAGGDISKPEIATEFLSALDAANPDRAFAYFLIHHTGKPIQSRESGQNKKDAWESAYQGFGSSYFANWPRATMLLEPRKGYDGEFILKLGKGGKNANLRLNDKRTTQIALRHSFRDAILEFGPIPRLFWEPSELPLEDDQPQPKVPLQDYSDDAILAFFPTQQNACFVGSIQKAAEKMLHISSSTFFLRLKVLLTNRRVIKTHHGKYHLPVTPNSD